MAEGIRLQRYLSQAGIAARRKAEELITSGAVTVNGKTVTTLGTRVIPGEDRVSVDGQAVYPQELFYALLNKPKGCITAVSDPHGRQTVMEYLQGVPVQIAPVGRLDYYSEGVLLLTNDGELSARLQSPEYHVEKTYHVKIQGKLRPAHLDTLRQGVRLDDGTMTRPAQVDILSSKSHHDWLVITLIEGKSRQIHRMLEALGYQVLKLQRVAFAGLTFHGLRVGDARELTQAEVNQLREQVELPRNTASRGKWMARREDTELSRRARARTRIQEAEQDESAFEERFDRRASDRQPLERRAPGRPAPGRPAPGRPASGRPSSGRPSSGRPAAGRPAVGRPAAGRASGPARPRNAMGAGRPARGSSWSGATGQAGERPGRSPVGDRRRPAASAGPRNASRTRTTTSTRRPAGGGRSAGPGAGPRGAASGTRRQPAAGAGRRGAARQTRGPRR